jgi:hypothetical protein
VELPSFVRLALVPVLIGALGAVLLGAGGRTAPRERTGKTTQGQEVRVKIEHGTATALETNALLRCTDGDRWNTGWTVPNTAIRHSGTRFSVLARAADITVRIDGQVSGGHVTGVLRAVGSRKHVRCDTGAVKFSA